MAIRSDPPAVISFDPPVTEVEENGDDEDDITNLALSAARRIARSVTRPRRCICPPGIKPVGGFCL